MQHKKHVRRTLFWFILWSVGAVVCFLCDRFPFADKVLLAQARGFLWAGVTLGIMATCQFLSLLTMLHLRRDEKPSVEGVMVARIYKLVAAIGIVLSLIYASGKLENVGTALAAFGGMLAGFSLQAPVSGLAAWVLISLKRPFRPGDRVQFPTLNLTGDVQDIGVMYTVLDQVGGSIGSEEAVGRYILVPNAMLFSQVAINYTVKQTAAYMLDEVVVRITFDSDWDHAERILLDAAEELTKEIVTATGVKPYIRSDMYDYGVYLRLRYQTRVQDRAEIAYRISKKIFEDIQHAPTVDIAIPFIYSYRTGARTAANRLDDIQDKEAENIRDLEVSQLRNPHPATEADVIAQLAQSIATQGLLQPIVVIRSPTDHVYDIAAGHQRFEACRKLGWKTIPAIVRDSPAPENGKAAPETSKPLPATKAS
ncbi:MAG: mechanosensitive ion channel [Planctomycetota bacterium]|nr:mechanosensitive ion channel [Planctomycetota bacterium]